jgi:nucleotide-binding universal stress UspA family protein
LQGRSFEQEIAMVPVKTVLHPTDLTMASRRAFDLACQIARDGDARIVALHVVPPTNSYSAEVVFGNPLAGLREIAPEVTIDTRIERGDPAGVILRVAEEIKCDLIVIGTHGRTGPSHWLTGHISDKVVRRARCGVLALPYPFRDNEPPLLNVRWEMAASTVSK